MVGDDRRKRDGAAGRAVVGYDHRGARPDFPCIIRSGATLDYCQRGQRCRGGTQWRKWAALPKWLSERTAGRVRSRCPWLWSPRNFVSGADAHAVRQRTITKTGTVRARAEAHLARAISPTPTPAPAPYVTASKRRVLLRGISSALIGFERPLPQLPRPQTWRRCQLGRPRSGSAPTRGCP